MEKEYKASFVRTFLYGLKYGFYSSLVSLIFVCYIIDKLLKIELSKDWFTFWIFVPFIVAYILCFIYCITSKVKISNDEIEFCNFIKHNKYSIKNNHIEVLAKRRTVNGIGFANRMIIFNSNNINKIEHCNFLNKQTFEELAQNIRNANEVKGNVINKSSNEYKDLNNYKNQTEFEMNTIYKDRLEKNKALIRNIMLVMFFIFGIFPLIMVLANQKNKNAIVVNLIFSITMTILFIGIYIYILKKNNKIIKSIPKKIILFDKGIKIDEKYLSYDTIEYISMQSKNSKTLKPYYQFKIKDDVNVYTYILGYEDKNIYFEIYDILIKRIPLKFKNELL